MPGVKGRSGGPRKNSGGARPGAGRKPKNRGGQNSANPPPAAGDKKRPKAKIQDPLDYLRTVFNDPCEDVKVRVRAAIGAAQYVHPKIGEGGKKDAKKEAANQVANKFAPAPPPLSVIRGGRPA